MPPITMQIPSNKRKYHVFHVLVHPTEEGGYWAELNFPNGGCTTQGETLQEIEKNMYEAIELCLDEFSEIKEYSLEFEVCNA